MSINGKVIEILIRVPFLMDIQDNAQIRTDYLSADPCKKVIQGKPQG